MAQVSIDFFSPQMLLSAVKQVLPVPHFFRDRYCPTAPVDIYRSDKVLVEFQDGDQKMAPFVAPRVGDIPVDREGFEVAEFAPARIAPSRLLTMDELEKKGFGEALYENLTPAERAARYQVADMEYLDKRIARREEWMAVQMFINNSITIQEYVDGKTAGSSYVMKFYSGLTSDHTYTVGDEWDDTNGDFFGDIEAMCDQLVQKGLPVEDLVLGATAAQKILKLQEVRERLNKESGIITGEINAKLSSYPGVAYYGKMNFGGYVLNIFAAKEMYKDDLGASQYYFPVKSALVTAPACAHTMYGAVTQIDYGQDKFTTHTGSRVPKVEVNQGDDLRKLRLTARPLTAPKAKSPFVYAANVVL